MPPSDELAPVPAVRFMNVSKAFSSSLVLRDVSFEIPARQKVAIIGRSGSGKTTLLRLLMTIEKPTSGIIEVEGELLGVRRLGEQLVPDAPAHLRRVRRKIGMVFQQFNLFPHMTALRNVMIAPVTVLHMQESEAAGLAREFLEMVGLADKANSFPRELSGGQQQRVAIARALAMRPHIMLFDEVTSALDPELVGEVLKVIRRLASETPLTMLIVTHEMSFARDVADRVLFLEQGMIEEDSPADVIFSAPRSEATRQFLRATLER